MRLIGKVVATCLVAAGAWLIGLPAQAQAQTLVNVKTRGYLLCGVNGQLPNFSQVNSNGEWSGFEVDFCRAIAAAVLGQADEVRFVPLTTVNRFDALRQGQVGLLTRNTIDTLERTAGTGVRDAVVLYLDRQVVVVARDLNATKLADLNKDTICTLRNTPYDTALDDWFGARSLTVKTALYDDQNKLYKASARRHLPRRQPAHGAVDQHRHRSGKAHDYIVLPDLVALQPLAAFVRAGDEPWFDVVRWTFNAMLKITRANVAAERTSANPEIRRLLGVDPGFGKLLSLDESWAFNILQQVGNYFELYERNVGTRSPLGFGRGVNALWSDGGIFFPLPLR